MAIPRRPVRSLSLSRRRSVLILLSVFLLYKAMHQVQIAFHNATKIVELREDMIEQTPNAVLVFNLHSKYPLVPSPERPRWLRTLLERDLKRLRRGSKAATISAATRAALTVDKPHSILLPAEGNVYPDGLYYVEVLLGRPAKLYYLDIDTGSDLTWLQCDAPCRSCAHGPHGLYDVSKARVVECRESLCAEVQQGRTYVCEEDLDGQWTQCDYQVDYADGSSTMGALISDYFTLLLSNGSQRHTSAIIGCGYDQHGHLAKSPALTDGVMGLSNAKGALPSQLVQKGMVKNVIGLCLSSDNHGGDYLFFGDGWVPSSGMMWVPMMGSLIKHGHYQARVLRIWHGVDEIDMRGAIDDMTFDSGASYTYFVPKVYNAVLSAVSCYIGTVYSMLNCK